MRSSLILSSLPLLGHCLAPPSFDGPSSRTSAARLFGQHQHQQSQQQYQQQEPVFETDGQRIDGYERVDQEADGEDDRWDEWMKEKYVVRDPFDEEFDRMVEETLEHWHVPGLSVAVVHGDTTFAKGYGKAILPDVDATPDTLYYVGSTTKSFTAAAILILIEESRQQSGATSSNNLPPNLSLTTPVSSLIRAEFVLPSAHTTQTATLEDLLTHRTGMPRHDLSYASSPNTTLAAHVSNLRHLPLTAPPRSTWQYCNLMYTALAYVVETLTSSTWGEFVAARIWRPLAMTATFASLADAKRHAFDRLSAPYFWDNATGRFVREPYVPDAPALVGAGNVLSCVRDYARYLRALLARRPNFFPGPEGFRELRRAARSVVSDPADAGEEAERGGGNAPWVGPELYGLGWMLVTYREGGLRVYRHGGAVTGYAAEMAYVPQAGWGVAVMANTEVRGGWAAERVVVALVERLAGTPVGERWDAVGVVDGRVAENRERRARARQVLFPEAPVEGGEGWLGLRLPLEAYEGVFEHEGYGRVRFVVEDGHGASPFEGGDKESGGYGAEGAHDGLRHKHLHADIMDKLWSYQMCLEHVSGEYFMAWLGATKEFPNALFDDEMPLKARFDVGVSGKVERLHLAMEPKMGEEMIVFKRADE